MRDFDLLRSARRWSEVNEHTRTSTIYGGADVEILREADQPGVTVSEVCGRHGLAPSVFYRWRAVTQGGPAVALKRDAQRKSRKDDPEARHKAEIERMRAVIAEITAENLELKKGFEAARFVPSTGGDQSGRDTDR
jgi:transposase-like protein